MCEAPVRQQIIDGVQPERGDKVDIRRALHQSAPEEGFLPKLLTSKGFADAGT